MMIMRFALAVLVAAGVTLPVAAAETPQESVKRLTNVIRQKPDDMDARRNIADAYVKMGLSVRAIEQMQIVMQYGQRSVDDYIQLGDAQRYSAKLSDAIRTYQEALNQSPQNAKALTGLAYCYMMSGDANTATKLCHAGIKQADAAGKRALSNVLHQIDTNKAQADLDKSLAASTKS